MLVSVVKMAIVLEKRNTEEQRSVVRFFVGKRTQEVEMEVRK
jgi:ABC-type Fe3+ transport system substrate-binding protein